MTNRKVLQNEIQNLDYEIKNLENSMEINKDSKVQNILERLKEVEELKIKRGARLLLLDEINDEKEIEKQSILINEENKKEMVSENLQKIFIPECAEIIPVITNIIENVVELIGDIEPECADLMTALNNMKTAKLLVDVMIIDIEKQIHKIEKEGEKRFIMN